jgi:DNA-binding MarR family transcriptional regulator
MRTPNAKKARVSIARDETGVLEALLSDLDTVQARFPGLTLWQYRIALEVLHAERRGLRHSVVSLARKVNMPMSSASRVIWQLTKGGGDVGVLRYERHATDRRQKYVRLEKDAARRIAPDTLLHALTRSSEAEAS